MAARTPRRPFVVHPEGPGLPATHSTDSPSPPGSGRWGLFLRRLVAFSLSSSSKIKAINPSWRRKGYKGNLFLIGSRPLHTLPGALKLQFTF